MVILDKIAMEVRKDLISNVSKKVIFFVIRINLTTFLKSPWGSQFTLKKVVF
jgi:hypothetical protein